jgi:YrbI family 3-deoxy-D-manno-octulosonate 8-phosphate phosphatase
MNATPQDIQVLALDVDGVLTDGTHSYDPSTNQELKSFHVHDGLGLSLWKNVGCEVVIISGRNAEVVTRRAIELGISHVYQGSTDKIADLQHALDQIGASPSQTAYVGDDLGDIPVMQHVGYAIAVADASQEVKDIANWVTSRQGGHGAVRDAVEHLMKLAGTWATYNSGCNAETAQ